MRSHSSPNPTPGPIRFGVFEVDPATGELRKKGLRVRLQGQPFKVLLLLIERTGEIVTREELHEHLWPSDTFVDFDRNLNKAVRKLREALGDNATSPRFIETLPRRGYRFLAPVERGPLTTARADEVEPTAFQSRRSGWILAAVVALLALGTLVWLPRRPVTDPSGVAVTQRLMLAVLPFDNLSDDPEDIYFGEGLAEEMTTTLGKLKPERLGVIARSSVERFRRRPRSLPEIGAELGVGYVVEGSVRRQERRVRVSAQLIRLQDQSQLWAEVYDRELIDVFSIQREVAEQIAHSLSVELMPAEKATLAAPTSNADAYQQYLRGLYSMRPFTIDAVVEASARFEQAIELDPDFALAHAMRSRAYWSLAQPLLGYPYGEAMEISKSAAMAALAIDEQEAVAYNALGWVQAWYDWDWTAAETSYLRALELNPSDVNARLGYAFLLSAEKLHERAIVEGEIALSHAPLDFGLRTGVAELYLHARLYDDAVAQSNKVLSMDADYQRAYLILRWVGEARGRLDEAVDAQERFLTLGGTSPEQANELQRAYETGGSEAYWRSLQRWLESGRVKFHRTELAQVLGGMGDNDAAFAALDEAYAARAGDLILLQVAPWFDPLRDDPRFDDLVARMRFPSVARTGSGPR